jgi:hypothetical protein
MRPDRRLRTLARRRGLCPVHSSRVWCAFCDYTWTGTAAELDECGALAQKSLAPEHPLPTYPCARCGEAALCLACAERAFTRAPARHDPLTLEERGRYAALSAMLQPRPRR